MWCVRFDSSSWVNWLKIIFKQSQKKEIRWYNLLKMPYFRECITFMKINMPFGQPDFHGGLHVFSGGSYIHTKMYFHESCNRHTGKIFVAKISWHLALTKIIFETWHILWRSPQWIIPATKMVRDGWLSRKCCFREARFMRGLSWELVVMDYFCVGFGYFRDCFRLPQNLHFLVVWSIYFLVQSIKWYIFHKKLNLLYEIKPWWCWRKKHWCSL